MAHLSEVQRFIDTPIGQSFERVTNIWSVYDEVFNYPRSVGSGAPRPQIPGNVAPVAVLPSVDVQPVSAPEGDSAVPSAGPAEVQAVTVIDPEFQPRTTVFEGAEGPYVAERTRETDWDWVYNQYVILNAPEEEDVPFHSGVIDWGVDVAAAVFGGILDPVGIGSAIQTAYAPSYLTGGVTGLPSLGQQTRLAPAPPGVTTMAACPPTGPKYAKICLATREITPLRRRRRRRLLTSSDIKDLSALKSIVGGAALQAAVVQAVRR